MLRTLSQYICFVGNGEVAFRARHTPLYQSLPSVDTTDDVTMQPDSGCLKCVASTTKRFNSDVVSTSDNGASQERQNNYFRSAEWYATARFRDSVTNVDQDT
jgi:hypothetical protein